ncbi:MAG: trigger factor, partial [Bacillota bacterium]
MNSELVKNEGGRATLKVTIPAKEFKDFYNSAVSNLSREVNIPGFRKGKAPKQIVISRLGENYVLSEAAQIAISKTYANAIQSNDVKPFSEPEYEVEQVEADKDFIYNIVVDILPEIELPEYKGVKAVKKVKKATDDEVDNVLKDLQKRHSQLVAVEDRDTVEEGDYILFDFKGFVDGEPFEGGAAENYTLEIGSNSFIPGFEDQLIGQKIGEEGKVTVTFPEDYHHEALKGKESIFEVKVNEIKKEELPELDDEFAKDVSDKETLDEYRVQIKEDLQKSYDHQAAHELEDQILTKLLEESEFDAPPSMVELQVEQIINDFKSRVEYQGISWELYLE